MILNLILIFIKNIFIHSFKLSLIILFFFIGDWGLGPIPNPHSPFNFNYSHKNELFILFLNKKINFKNFSLYKLKIKKNNLKKMDFDKVVEGNLLCI